jgi:5-formyltetrahydrofolate cyclo-ligase
MKNSLCRDLIENRKKISKSEVLEKSELIKNRLFEMKDFQQALTILFYVSYDNEVYTRDMIKESIKLGKNVIVPKSDKENRKLILSKLNNWEDLVKGAYGILEPKEIDPISIDKIDLIIVPGVGFDKQGRRIGHGKGYYDNLLRNSKKTIHIGLAFEFQIVEKIPTEAHDVPVQKIITEKRVIGCI